MRLATWSEFKQKCITQKRLRIQWAESDVQYNIWASDGEDLYSVIVPRLLDNQDPNLDATDFELNYKPSTNMSYPVTSTGVRIVASDFIDGNRVTWVSHDFCDKTSWWQNASKAPFETLVDKGSHTEYQSAHTFWLNLDKVTDREVAYPALDADITRRAGLRYRAFRVYVNGILQDDSAYVVDYALGKVTFLTPLLETDVVTSSYYYATTSTWVLQPPAGFMLRIYRMECQFSIGINLLSDQNGMSFRIKAGEYVIYEKCYFDVRDFLNSTNLGILIPKSGGLSQDIVVLPWDYQSYIDIRSSQGLSLEILLEKESTPLSNGEIATAAFYSFLTAE